MDIIFSGKSSSYVHKYDGKDVRLLIKSSSNEEDPLGIYRIVKFNTLKKQCRIQWFEFEPAVLASEEAQKSGFLNFTGHKYGEQTEHPDVVHAWRKSPLRSIHRIRIFR